MAKISADDRANKLIETLGFKKAKTLVKQTIKNASKDSDWHYWNSVLYKIKKLQPVNNSRWK